MSRNVRRKVSQSGKILVDLPSILGVDDEINLKLPKDLLLEIFLRLDNRDRASLASTCRSLRLLGRSECLWQSLNFHLHKFNAKTATSLASRCGNLKKVRIHGARSANAVKNLKTFGLLEFSGEHCRRISDATLVRIAAAHNELEILQLGVDFCKRISSDAIKTFSSFCPKLRKLQLSGIRDLDGVAINALVKNCPNLTEISLMYCENVDVISLGNMLSIENLSVAGSDNIDWLLVSEHWSQLPNLRCLDVSRTDITAAAVFNLLSSSQSLKVMCALNCPALKDDARIVANKYPKGKLLVTLHTDTFKGVASLFADTVTDVRKVFSNWRKSYYNDHNLNEIVTWLEWTLSHLLLCFAGSNSQGLDDYWFTQGVALLVNLTKSSEEVVQERAATALAYLVSNGGVINIDPVRCEAVIREGGILQLLYLLKSCKEGVHLVATKVIAYLSANPKVAEAIVKAGGISIVVNLLRSMNRLPSVTEAAASILWNLSAEEHRDAIAEAGGLQVLVDLIVNWSTGGDKILVCAAGALATFTVEHKFGLLVAEIGGLNALVGLVQSCKCERVQEQVARALANLANLCSTGAVLGQDVGALEALVQLLRSPHNAVRDIASSALMRLCLDDECAEGVVAAGGVEALVDLARSCLSASPNLQEKVVCALWGLSSSESNSIAIGREGGVTPLIALARCAAENVQESIAGVLSNLAFHPSNALKIWEDGGLEALCHLCSSCGSKVGRFCSAVALSYLFEGRMDEFGLATISLTKNLEYTSIGGAGWKRGIGYIEEFINTSYDPQAFIASVTSSSPASLTEMAESCRILEAGYQICSTAKIERFILMLRNPIAELKTCAAFALLQFTLPGGKCAFHNSRLVINNGGVRTLRAAAAAVNAPIQAKIFAKIVLQNLEQLQKELQCEDFDRSVV